MSNLGRIVIAGGSGFLGRSLAHYLTSLGRSVVILSRNRPAIDGPWEHLEWDGRSLGPWCQTLDGASGIVNLAGRSVDCIKTPDHQDEILRSRVEATRVLGLAMRTLDDPPPVWVQMSTAHIYGDPPRLVCSEDSPVGLGLAPLVGQAWEQEFASSVLPSQRSVILRTSFVIGRDRGAGGGALVRLRTLVRLGFGGKIGSGTQGMSWIHEMDFNRLVERALNDSNVTGTYVASAPNPVSQRKFMGTLRRVMKMPIGLPAYAWMVRIGAPLFMRTDPELAIYGRYVVSRRLRDEQFQFAFPLLEESLRDLLGRQRCAPVAPIAPSHFSDTLATSSSVARTASISSSVVE
ncbi:MAG: epimerase [Pirellulales bacterium]